ncbi:MAG TPA: cell division protein SepF [Ruminococcaceae bacterium]|nr:cell division protein SepF [Oscillospiraceae bacterium]
MKFVDKLRRLTGSEDDDDDERDYDIDEGEDDDGMDYEDSIRPRRSSSISSASSAGKVLNIPATTRLQVVVVKAEKFTDAGEIADHFKNKRAVVLNLDNTNKDIANRLIDFLAGVAYASDGELKRIANTSYILVPYNVDISGDMLEELERNNSDSFI